MDNEVDLFTDKLNDIMPPYAKLFTNILNQRLLSWSSSHDVISDAQFGFQPGRGTVDAIFSLNAIILNVLSSKKKLYCVFID